MFERRLEKNRLFLNHFRCDCCALRYRYTIFSKTNISDGPGKWYKQLFYFIIGLMTMYFMSRVNYQLLGSYALPIYLFSIFLLILTLIPALVIFQMEGGSFVAKTWPFWFCRRAIRQVIHCDTAQAIFGFKERN